MTPYTHMAEGDVAANAHWALVQHHTWSDRRRFASTSGGEVAAHALVWRLLPECPWYAAAQYLGENGQRVHAGQAPHGR